MNPQNSSRRILIVRAGAVGDVLMATPLISAIRNVFPNSYLGFLTSRYAIPLLQYNKEIDALYDIRYRKLPYWISMEKQKLVKKMREGRWDVIFLLESNPIFAALVKKFNAEAVYGFNPPPLPFMKGGEGEFKGIQFLPDSHVISNFLKLGSLLGKDLKEFPMKICWPDSISERVNLLLSGLPANSPKIAIHAGFGPARRRGKRAIGIRSWPIERFRETISRLHRETLASFVLTGTLKEFKINEAIREGLNIPILNLAGQTTVPELGALLKEMGMVISIDSSPAHIAAAVGTPLIVLWGPAIEANTSPRSINSPVAIINKHLPCSPCYETPRKDACKNNICMQAIQVEEVVREALKLLKPRINTNFL